MQEEDSGVYRRWMCSVNWVKAAPKGATGCPLSSVVLRWCTVAYCCTWAFDGVELQICTVLCIRSLSGYCTCCLQCCVTTGGKIFSPHNTRKGKCTLFSAENVKVWLWCMQNSSQLSSETHSFISTHTLYTLCINEKFEVSPIFFQIISNFVFMRELFCWRWRNITRTVPKW